MAETTETLILDIQFDSEQAIKETVNLKNEVAKLSAANKELIKVEGQVTDEYVKNQAEIKRLNAEIRTNERNLFNQAKAATSAEGSNEKLRAQLSILTAEYNKLSFEERESTVAGQVLQKQIENISNTLKGSEGAVGDFRRNVGDYEGAFVRAANSISGMRDRLKELDQVINTTDVGTQQFKDASDEAANLRLSIDQALGKVDEYGEREPKNPSKKAFEDTVAAAGALTSAAELTSLALSDNEDVNESVAKSLRAVAVAQQVANIVREKGAIIDTASAVATGAASAAQTAYAFAVGTSTGLLKAFRVALLSTGIGALIVGLGLLIANFDDVSDAIKDFLGLSSEQERAAKELSEAYAGQANQLEFLLTLENRRISQLNSVFDRQIKLAQAAGKETIDIEVRKAEAFQRTTNGIIEQVKQQLNVAKAANVSAAEQIKLQQQIQDLSNQVLDSVAEIEAKKITLQKQAQDEALKNSQERRDREKADLEKRNAELEKNAQEELKIARELQRERIALVEDERQKEILLVRQAAEERLAAITVDTANAQSLRVAINLKAEEDIAAIQVQFAEEKKQRDQEALAEELAILETLTLKYNEALLNREQQTINRYLFEKTQRDLNILDEEAALLRTTESLNQLVAIEQATGKSRKDILADYYTFFEEQGELSYEEYLRLLSQQVDAQKAANDELTAAYSAFGEQVGSIFADSLTEQGLELKNFGRKFLILILDTLKKQVLSNIATAATSSLAQPDSVATFGASGAIRAAILTAAINGAAGLAISRLSQPPQGFATGVIGLQGAGNSTSDSIPAMLSRGESVVTATGTLYAQQNYPGLLEFLNSPYKFATGITNFQNQNVTPPVAMDGFSILAEAIRDIQPVVKVDDINKKQSDFNEVRVVGTI